MLPAALPGTLTPYSGVHRQLYAYVNENRHIHIKNKIEPYKEIFLEFCKLLDLELKNVKNNFYTVKNVSK